MTKDLKQLQLNMSPQLPQIGVATFLFSPTRRPGEFLLGKRKGALGANTWALPGGHLEFGESFETCAAREILEETGLSVDERTLRYLTATNDIFAGESESESEGLRKKHYVTIFMVGRVSEENEKAGKEAVVMEKEKCERWEWVSWTELVAMARVEEQNVVRGGESGVGDGPGVRRLFQPMRDLLMQRPGLVPCLE